MARGGSGHSRRAPDDRFLGAPSYPASGSLLVAALLGVPFGLAFCRAFSLALSWACLLSRFWRFGPASGGLVLAFADIPLSGTPDAAGLWPFLVVVVLALSWRCLFVPLLPFLVRPGLLLVLPEPFFGPGRGALSGSGVVESAWSAK